MTVDSVIINVQNIVRVSFEVKGWAVFMKVMLCTIFEPLVTFRPDQFKKLFHFNIS